jgi:hypothetical protein
MNDEFENENEDPSNAENQIEKKKRGAPYGNKNAYKHGFYARHYTPQEVSDFEEMEPLDVRNEIELIRALMRRVLESSQTSNTHGENLDTLRAICMGNLTLTRLIRTQFLKPQDPENTLHGIISNLIKEIDDGMWPENNIEGAKLLRDQDSGLRDDGHPGLSD